MIVKRLGQVAYEPSFAAMRAFTASRTPATEDELWLCEHPPVFTQGVAGRAEHVHEPGPIPVVQADRGGQVTFHGPGQVVAYPLVDLKRLGIYVKEYVFRLEQAVLQTLERYEVSGHRIRGEPGIYVRIDDPFGHAVLARSVNPAEPFAGVAKIAAIGVKVSRHCAYHGMALNVAMDLQPFDRIDACGHPGLKVTDLSTIGVAVAWDEVASTLGGRLAAHLSP
ncbi:MAG: lipoyl(octanoyl) transferase LipB [Pseudomonadota bacterium]|nr:lipoyl(octanoyl) transferase LipB [Pseudomonadota bacterium]